MFFYFNFMSIIPQKIDWDEKFSVKVKELDEQHKNLIFHINELIDVLRSVPSFSRIKTIQDKLLASETEHFATEEKYFIKFDYPQKDKHIATHQKFVADNNRLQELYEHDPEKHLTELIYFLEEWWLDHIMGMDHEYADFFNQHGLH